MRRLRYGRKLDDFLVGAYGADNESEAASGVAYLVRGAGVVGAEGEPGRKYPSNMPRYRKISVKFP